jgi:hypothetical protein
MMITSRLKEQQHDVYLLLPLCSFLTTCIMATVVCLVAGMNQQIMIVGSCGLLPVLVVQQQTRYACQTHRKY